MYDLRAYYEYLAKMHTDRMDITSKVVTEDEDGASNSYYPETPQERDVPCRISLLAKDKPNEDGPYEKVSFRAKVFCATPIAIKAGDRVTVRRLHPDGTVFETYSGFVSVAGNPGKWAMHQEFELSMEGDA